MPKANRYEYGQLQKRNQEFWFYSNENGSGEKIKNHIYLVLNQLARSSWEPCLHYVDQEGEQVLPTWIMRRQAPQKPLTPAEQKLYAKPIDYRHEKDEDED